MYYNILRGENNNVTRARWKTFITTDSPDFYTFNIVIIVTFVRILMMFWLTQNNIKNFKATYSSNNKHGRRI